MTESIVTMYIKLTFAMMAIGLSLYGRQAESQPRQNPTTLSVAADARQDEPQPAPGTPSRP